jgi:predicted membrane protein
MRDFDKWSEDRRARWENRMQRSHRRGHIWTGFLFVLIGGAALLRSYVPDFPQWVFSWQMLLIVLGTFIGVRHRFHCGEWFMLMLIGGYFLVNDYFLDKDTRVHTWPVILIIMGLFFIFRSRKQSSDKWLEKKNAGGDPLKASPESDASYSQDDFIDTTSIFGGAKKIILSKNFRGGDIVNVFGGTELNLMQADIVDTAELELTTIFGGTKLILPSNWSVKSEAVTIFGGIEDKRQISPGMEQSNKVLLLKGTVIFGGIDIKSY